MTKVISLLKSSSICALVRIVTSREKIISNRFDRLLNKTSKKVPKEQREIYVKLLYVCALHGKNVDDSTEVFKFDNFIPWSNTRE